MAVRLPFRLAAPGARSQRQARLVVGRPRRRPSHGPFHSVARPQRYPRGTLGRRGLTATWRLQTRLDRRAIVSFLAIILTVKWVTREGFEIARLRIGRIRPYITAALVVPACFAATYGLTWLLGLGSSDWQLVEFRSLFASAGAE